MPRRVSGQKLEAFFQEANKSLSRSIFTEHRPEKTMTDRKHHPNIPFPCTCVYIGRVIVPLLDSKRDVFYETRGTEMKTTDTRVDAPFIIILIVPLNHLIYMSVH